MEDNLVDENMLQEAVPQGESPKKVKGILLAGIIVIVLLGMLFIIWQINKSRGGRTADDVTAHFLKALSEQDADEMYGLLSPDYIQYMEDEGSLFGMTPKSDVSDQMDFFFEDLRDYYEIGKYKSFSYDDDDIEMLEYRGDDLSEMKEYFLEEFKMEIDAFTQANISIHAEGTKKTEAIDIELYLFQVGKRWYYIDWYWY